MDIHYSLLQCKKQKYALKADTVADVIVQSDYLGVIVLPDSSCYFMATKVKRLEVDACKL